MYLSGTQFWRKLLIGLNPNSLRVVEGMTKAPWSWRVPHSPPSGRLVWNLILTSFLIAVY